MKARNRKGKKKEGTDRAGTKERRNGGKVEREKEYKEMRERERPCLD